jgi:Na+/H+ antiporter NhaD/arsenite permease-like protein
MMFGGFRGLALDRTGVVLVGALTLVGTGSISLAGAWQSADVPTLALLFGLMLLSAQFRLSGFYTLLAGRLGGEGPPMLLLGKIIALAAGLSALLTNDIICLAMAPLVIEVCAARRLNPMPHLLGLACAANIGGAATLIGNPQNMLIGQSLGLDFLRFTLGAAFPSLLSLIACWGIIAFLYRARWGGTLGLPAAERQPLALPQAAKGVILLVILVVLFLAAPFPREVVALVIGGAVLLTRRYATQRILELVDWNLLLLFLGLFVVNQALAETGMLARAVTGLKGAGVDLQHGGTLYLTSAILSNLVSNVPAVMLLLQANDSPEVGLLLALGSTFAGNLILVGSIANIIVAEQAAKAGIRFSAREHAVTGIPVTLASLLIGWLWLFA